MTQLRSTVAEISVPHLLHNLNLVKSWSSPGQFFCPMVKANAYGHGDVEVSRVLEKNGVTHLGVVMIEEGIRLRQAGVQAGILVFGILDSTFGAEALIENRLTPVVGDFRAFEILGGILKKQKIKNFKVHVELNTGMNRLGFGMTQFAEVLAFLKSNTEFELAGLCTHFYEGRSLGRGCSSADEQVEKLHQAAQLVGQRIALHALNTDGALALANRAQNAPIGFRPGIALYGGEPTSEVAYTNELKPVMTFKTHVATFHQLQPGEIVSYNGTWKASRASLIGVLPVGYADGYMRALSNRGFVLCRGERAPVIGTVCMDYMMVDLTDVRTKHGDLMPAEPIVLWGEQGSAQLRAEEMAQLVGTISYELFTRVGARVPRVLKEDS